MGSKLTRKEALKITREVALKITRKVEPKGTRKVAKVRPKVAIEKLLEPKERSKALPAVMQLPSVVVAAALPLRDPPMLPSAVRLTIPLN